MKLIIGLGNPGSKYERTRHNAGFIVLDELAKLLNCSIEAHGFNGVYYKNKDYILLKPLTFMNLSGDSVVAIMNFYKIELSDIVVVYDDIDTELGKIRLRYQGSSGGHNGIKHLIATLKSDNFNRIRIGIGKNTNALIDHVLSNFTSAEIEMLAFSCQKACEALRSFLTGTSFLQLMNIYN